MLCIPYETVSTQQHGRSLKQMCNASKITKITIESEGAIIKLVYILSDLLRDILEKT